MDIKFITFENVKASLHTTYSFNRAMDLRLDNVVPGQPLQIHWRYRRFRDPWNLDWNRKWTGIVNARFYVEGQLTHEHGNIAVTDALDGTGQQTENVIIHDRNLANALYRVGRKWLDIEIIRHDKPATPYRWTQDFWVVPEPFDLSWWQWRVPAFESVPWKTGYVLIADFVNNSRYAGMSTLSYELSEVRNEDNPQIDPCNYNPIQISTSNGIAPSGRMPMAFSLKHDWGWITPAAYVIYGPLNKTFSYAVWFKCSDEFGNIYGGVCSSRLVRHIGVSKEKRVAGAAAFSAAATAAALAIAGAAAAAGIITAIGAPFLFAAAAVAYGVAAASGEIAKDPPAPDPEFRQPVEVVPLRLPKWPDKADDLEPAMVIVQRVLESGAHLLALENARTVARARIMAAAMFGDQEAREGQKQGYLKIEMEMAEAANQLDQPLPELENVIESEQVFNPKDTAAWAGAMASTGLPRPVLATMADAGLDIEQLNGLAALVTQGWLMEEVAERGLLFMVLLIENLHEFVELIQAQREHILAGETYVEPPLQRGTVAQVPLADVEAQFRPRAKRGYC